MMHEYYELSIAQVIRLSAEDFLARCSEYLVEALEVDRLLEVDRQAREYARRYLGIKDASEWFPW